MSNILELHGINTYYGLSHILFDLSLEVHEGEVVGLLGRNGAGKTTTLRSVIGLNYPNSGKIVFYGQDMTRTPAYVRSRKGMGYVPEDRRIFPELTVEENLKVAQKDTKKGEWTLERVYQLFPALEPMRNRNGKTLSGGEQQMLTVARALMGNPQLLLLDEVSEGLAPAIVKALKECLLELKKTGISMLVCEQNLAFVTELSDRAYIMENGELRYQGDMAQLERDRGKWEQYLAV